MLFLNETYVHLQSGILKSKKIVEEISSLASKIALVTQTSLVTLYAKPLLNALIALGKEVIILDFPSGEQNKTRQTKEYLEDRLIEKGFSKDTCIVGIGGGVVTDLAGYLAATFCRGVPLVLIPTSLLGMVDSSIGGKNGVNTLKAKNMIGTIYQPKFIFIDPECLKTLSQKELKNGVVEMLKHGLIASRLHFEFLENNRKAIVEKDEVVLAEAIRDSIQIKMKIVKEDEQDKGVRQLLNFGHTVGHGIENILQYQISHGEAVALGMIRESEWAVRLGVLDSKVVDRIKKVLEEYEISIKWPDGILEKELNSVMKLDKKALKGNIRFIALEEIGSAKISTKDLEKEVS